MEKNYYLIPESKIDSKVGDALVRLDDEFLDDSVEEMLDNETRDDIDPHSCRLGFLACARQLREYVS